MPPPSPPRPSITKKGPAVKGLTGVLAIALLLAATRWGSYLGVSPLFLTDILIAAAIVDRIAGNSVRGVRPLTGRTGRATPGLLFAVFYTYLVARFLVSLGGDAPLMTSLRDGIPYLYAGLAFASASALARASDPDRARTMRYLWWALTAHLIWVSAVSLTGVDTSAFPKLPDGTPVFALRPDIDAAILGVTAAMLLRQLLRGHRKRLSIIGIGLVFAAVAVELGTRAGFISILLCLSAAWALTYAATDRLHGRRVAMTVALPVIVAVLIAVVPDTTPGQRLLASMGLTEATGSAELNAVGTKRAREHAWALVTEWTTNDDTRMLFGAGFGLDFLAESGALTSLQGTEYSNVRSPHNWLVGTFARLGVIGVALTAAVLALLLGIVVRFRRQIGADDVLMLGALIVVAIIPVALLGVVLEAPFGAVPFWWAAGLLLALPAAHRPRP